MPKIPVHVLIASPTPLKAAFTASNSFNLPDVIYINGSIEGF
ncbi:MULTISPECIES: hypothetical protein [Calothrix]|nr:MULTISPECIES: hypothetical protein [Calothrix]